MMPSEGVTDTSTVYGHELLSALGNNLALQLDETGPKSRCLEVGPPTEAPGSRKC